MIDANKSGMKDHADTLAACFDVSKRIPEHDVVRDYLDFRTGGEFGPARLDILTGMVMARLRKAHAKETS